jgi:nucleotide-binding universal stress UspA family protein
MARILLNHCARAFSNAPNEQSMESIQKILVPIDFSDHCARVLQLAAELCRKHEASATLLYVWAPEWVPAPGTFQLYDPRSLPNGLSHLRQALDTAKHELLANGALQVDTSLEYGNPDREIVNFARAGGFSMIVMGTHGRGGLSHALMGSVAELVVRRAPCPVVTVRLDGKSQSASDTKAETPPSDTV